MKNFIKVNSPLSIGIVTRTGIWYCCTVGEDEIRPTNNDTGIVAVQRFTKYFQREGGD